MRLRNRSAVGLGPVGYDDDLRVTIDTSQGCEAPIQMIEVLMKRDDDGEFQVRLRAEQPAAHDWCQFVGLI